ncbi:MAG: 3-hydroxyacyl-CoA dehydrogenase NAD-binding domain-containing protein [Deltaproteobacteria bacterium]|nr:3-hydroxyacyl-CoA dehydrogenase NAD-binding domain-containing protein [Deltaproteobacteria bacterium]
MESTKLLEQKIAVIGAGLMGHAIAQLLAAKANEVSLFDSNRQVLESAPARIRSNFGVLLGLGFVARDQVELALSKIRVCDNLEDAVTGAGLVIEAVSEDLALKRQIFAALENHVSSETVLCSNTSAISISLIAESLEKKERLVGTHFWNPPHIVPCVEVIRSVYTSEETFETVYKLMKQIGKRPVKVLRDVPGFLGNRMQHALWREAMSLVQQGIATPEDIDEVVKSGFGLRMPFLGPLETADLAGLDLSFEVHENLFPHLETTAKPLPVLAEKVEQGDLGAKTGRGFHKWPKEKLEQVLTERDHFLLKISRLISG